MLSRIVPAGVETQECLGGAPVGALLPEEEAVVARAVPRRRREFAAVRGCARTCLMRLDHPGDPILPGPGGAPTWPAGVRGSLTHCDGYAAAAVGLSGRFAAIGIDAEVDAPLPDGVLDVVTTPSERDRLDLLPVSPGGPSWDRLVFSAKEAVYKAWFPLVGEWLDHGEAEILLDPAQGAFTAVLARPGLVVAGRHVGLIEGRWARMDGVLLTAVVISSTADQSLEESSGAPGPVQQPTRTWQRPSCPG